MDRIHLPLAWVPTSGGNIPQNAVVGGRDNSTSEDLYVGRAHHAENLIPGKVHKSHGVLYVPFFGKEFAIKDYEILVSDNQSCLKWIPESGGKHLDNAVKGGFEKRDTLYVARAKVPDEAMCVGKLHPPTGLCYIPWGGLEHSSENYEVLTCLSSDIPLV